MKPTILVIEDDSMTTRIVEMMLSYEGYRILCASDGPQGVRMAQDHHPDLVVLDLMLPGQNGYEVLQELRAEPRTANVPVVILSAKTQPHDKHTAATLGADAYLTKPYSRLDLVAVVGSLLDKESTKASA
jgi:DNA-binding response OmpR family regulator